jgi:hypothetical protein
MKLNYTTRNGRLTVELEGRTQPELFEQLAQFQEVFENVSCGNGKDNSDVVNFLVREVDDNKYYELVCVDEGKPALRYSKKRFGLHKSGKTLFPKGDWVKWDKEKNAEVNIKTGKVVEKEEEKK